MRHIFLELIVISSLMSFLMILNLVIFDRHFLVTCLTRLKFQDIGTFIDIYQGKFSQEFYQLENNKDPIL